MLENFIDSFHFYFLLATIQGTILSLIIIFSKKNNLPNIFFGLLIFQFSMALLELVLGESIHFFNAKFPLVLSYGMALGPLAYFHVKSILNPNFKFKAREIRHFLPAFLIEFLLSSLFFLYVKNNIDWAYQYIDNINLVFTLLGILILLHIAIYSYFIHRMIRKENKLLSSEIKSWFQSFYFFGIAFLGFLLITMIVSLFNTTQLDEGFRVTYPISILFCVIIYWLGYKYLLKHRKTIDEYLTKMKNRRHSSAEITERKTQLTNLLIKEKLYENKSFTVEELSAKLQWQSRDVSFIISEGFDTNFNDLINTYRINAFKELIVKSENKKYSVVGIAEKVGFSSKTSFYRAFKKECGVTPSEYLKKEGLK